MDMDNVLVAAVFGSGGVALMLAASARSAMSIKMIPWTQRYRYGRVVYGLFAYIFGTVLLFADGPKSPMEIFGLVQAWKVLPVMYPFVAVGMIFWIVSPLVFMLACVRIYRNPQELAYRTSPFGKERRYVTTASARSGRRDEVVVQAGSRGECVLVPVS